MFAVLLLHFVVALIFSSSVHGFLCLSQEFHQSTFLTTAGCLAVLGRCFSVRVNAKVFDAASLGVETAPEEVVVSEISVFVQVVCYDEKFQAHRTSFLSVSPNEFPLGAVELAELLEDCLIGSDVFWGIDCVGA